MENQYLRVHNFAPCTGSLGPGRRTILWLQGCERRCPGCMSPESRSLQGGHLIPLEEVYKRITRENLKEVTISGGEPFLQSRALSSLTERLHSDGYGIIIYTGYTLEELYGKKDEYISKVLDSIDLLIDGEYVDDLNDGRRFVGSSNQRIISLSGRYPLSLLRENYNSFHRDDSLDSIANDDGIFVLGVPSKEMLEKLKNLNLQVGK